MEAKNSSVQIPKLSDTNFHTWRQRVKFVLAIKELEEYLVNDPPERTDAAYQTWLRNDRKAQAFIGLTLDEDHLVHVRDVKTAKEMFQSITDLFERVTLLNKLVARRKFYTVTMQDDEKVLSYINRVKTLASTMRSMGVEIAEEELAMTVLSGLPPRFDNLISALDALGDDLDVCTVEYIKGRLLQEERRSEIRTEDAQVKSELSALVAKKCEDPAPAKVCSHCGKRGHPESKCWTKFPYLRPPRGRPAAKAVVAIPTETVEFEDPDTFCLMAKDRNDETHKSALTWMIDSGCTSHMTFDISLFVSYKKVPFAEVELGNSECARVAGMGDVIISVNVEGRICKRKLKDVLHVPDLGFSLLSVAKLEEKGLEVSFKTGKCKIFSGATLVATATRMNDLYLLDVEDTTGAEVACVGNLQVWHERLAHSSSESIVNMVNQGIVTGISINGKDNTTNCKGCIYGKSKRTVIPKSSNSRAKAVLDLVHSDVSGPIDVPSLGGSRYFITFIDDHSNWTVAYAIREKSDSLAVFKKFHKYAEAHTGQKIKLLNVQQYTSSGSQSRKGAKLKAIRTDNGGEYISREFQAYLSEHGIHHQLTVAYTPQQNGTAERMNRTLMDLIRCMLHQKNIPKKFWAEALSTAVYIRNRMTSRSLPANTTPYHIWMQSTPNLKNLRVFGSKCWYVIPKKNIKKLDARACEGMFVGYSANSKGYKIWDPKRSSFVVSRDVKFDEGFEIKDANEADRSVEDESPVLDLTTPDNASNINDADSEANEEEVDTSDIKAEEQDEEVQCTSSSGLRRSTRISKPPGKFWLTTGESAFLSRVLPSSYAQAMASDEADFWKPGFEREMDALQRNETWELVPRKNNMNVLSGRWVFKIKNGLAKLRWVAKGFLQVHGVDYGETYAPVVKLTSVRVLLSFVAAQDLELHQMDVVTAFLHGDVEEDIYVEQPHGYEDPCYPEYVCKLKKALYGLKQSPRMWHAKIDQYLTKELGFSSSSFDPCVYIRRKDGHILIIALYVDDLLIAGDNMASVTWIKTELGKRFEMKDLGEAKVCLGLEITRDRKNRTLKLTQTGYAEQVVEKFGMSGCKPVPTPLVPRHKNVDKNDPTQDSAGNVPYRSAIGCIMWLSIATRPDLGYAFGYLSQFSADPLVEHWAAVKRVLRYIAGTMDLGIVYGKNSSNKAVGFSDSDWGGCQVSRKSTSGYVFFIAGGPVSWRSKKQTITALSSCEAEYIASSDAAKEAIWLKRLTQDITSEKSQLPVMLYLDNQGAKDTAYNSGINHRNKHIDIKYHFVREAIQNNKVQLKWIPGETNVADILTKPLDKVKFQRFVSDLSLH